ncbi:MAG: TetR family transcriptional regulator [Ilumatobacteraceae bacterium]
MSADRGAGRVSAEQRLVEAAAEMLAEVGPRAMSVRQVAERAGVNHGLVHHYFGGKDGLLRAAMRRLVSDHERWAREVSGGGPFPVPMALGGDQRYLRAVVRSLLDGETDLALTELSSGVSVPRQAMEAEVARRGLDAADVETKATVGAAMALEMGWAALEEFIFAVTGTTADEADNVRTRVRELRAGIAQRERLRR